MRNRRNRLKSVLSCSCRLDNLVLFTSGRRSPDIHFQLLASRLESVSRETFWLA